MGVMVVMGFPLVDSDDCGFVLAAFDKMLEVFLGCEPKFVTGSGVQPIAEE
jgi:hypothetical protein